MENYYSDTLREGLRLLYFQADEARFREGVELLEQAVAKGGTPCLLFPGEVLWLGGWKCEGG